MVADMARPTWAINHTAPDATQRAASENTASTPALPPAPATLAGRAGHRAARRARPRGATRGTERERLEHGQCTPCPAWKKKLTMAGAAPISSAANAETSTVRRPLKDWW